jgi:hypothetical protein
MDLHRLGVKFFAADPASIKLPDFIPVFHAWIQKQNLTGHLLIDVHDYSHVHQGPGILLVAHEGNFSLDTEEGRPGLLYYRKTPTGLAPVEHLAAVMRSGLQACRLLEKEARVRFAMDELLVLANDRLNAPNDNETFKHLQPILAAALKQVFESAAFELSRKSQDPKERLVIGCKR